MLELRGWPKRYSVMTNRKTALITGANHGLGSGMAQHLTEAGVAVLGTRRTGACEPGFVHLDVTRPETFPDFVATVQRTLREEFATDRIDYLINNAGIGIYAPYADTTPAQFDDLVNTNLKGPFFLTQSLLPLLREGARVLNVTTALTRGVVPGMAAYAAAKGARFRRSAPR